MYRVPYKDWYVQSDVSFRYGEDNPIIIMAFTNTVRSDEEDVQNILIRSLRDGKTSKKNDMLFVLKLSKKLKTGVSRSLFVRENVMMSSSRQISRPEYTFAGHPVHVHAWRRAPCIILYIVISSVYTDVLALPRRDNRSHAKDYLLFIN